MNKKSTFFYAIALLLILVNIFTYVIPFFKKSDINLENVNFEAQINTDDLITSYLSNENKTNTNFNGKIIEVTGNVKKVTFLNNRNTVILYGENKDSGIICDVHPSQIEKLKLLTINQKIAVKGICKGFLKDVILLNCIIDNQPNE